MAFACTLLLASLGPAEGQGRAPEPPPPEWASIEGWEVFAKSGCGKCHSLRGVGGGLAFDLAALPPRTGFFELAAAVWNHVPRMGARMWESGIERLLSGRQTASLLAFVFSAQYLDVAGDPATGERLFMEKGCAGCHALGRGGPARAPALDGLKKSNSPVFLAAAMWNHGLDLAERMRAEGVTRSSLRPGDLDHILAHVMRVARETGDATVRVVAETSERGEVLFMAKGCAGCHAVGSRLGPGGRHVSLGGFGELMWNHGPAMWTAMRPGALSVRLTGQDMGGLIAHLFASRYFDHSRGDGYRGRRLVESKGCLGCHTVNGRGGKLASDLATSNVVGSLDGQVAAMWNHGRLMSTAAQRRAVALPELSGQEFADIATYLGGLGRRPSR